MATRRLSALAIALILGLGLSTQGALPAIGCSCMMPDPYRGLVEADGAFVGTLIAVDRETGPIFDSSTLIDFEFEVEAALKGDIGETIVVKSAADGASCGFEMPVGERVGILLDRTGGKWEGNLCWTLDADALLAAVEGPPAPVTGSPPHVVASVSMGEAGLVALNREGDIVGYGRGLPPWLMSVCPGGERFMGTASDGSVQFWSFTDLEVVGAVPIGQETSNGVYNLVCTGEEEFFLLSGGGTGDIPDMSLLHYVAGAGGLISENVQSIVPTKTGLLAIGGDGVVHQVDTTTGDLDPVTEPLGDIRGQTAALALSPDEQHLALATVDWTRDPYVAGIAVADLTTGAWAEMPVDCDVYPIWLDGEQLTFQDSCVSEEFLVYTSDLELIGPGENPWPLAYGPPTIDETGTRFLPAEYGVDLLEPGSETAIRWARLPTYPNQVIVVPEDIRDSWTGSGFIPAPPAEIPPVTFNEPFVEPLPIEIVAPADDGRVLPLILGSALVTGVLWLILRRPGPHAPPDRAQAGSGDAVGVDGLEPPTSSL